MTDSIQDHVDTLHALSELLTHVTVGVHINQILTDVESVYSQATTAIGEGSALQLAVAEIVQFCKEDITDLQSKVMRLRNKLDAIARGIQNVG